MLTIGSCLASADSHNLIVGGPVTGTTLTIQDSALASLGFSNGIVTAYIDPYHGTLDGQAVTLFCIDPNHLDNNNPSGYPVTISGNGIGSNTLQQLNLNGKVQPESGSLSNAATLAGFSNTSQLYGGLAWLSEQLQQSTNTLTQQEIQAAIWQLGDYTSTFTVVNPPQGFGSFTGPGTACGLSIAVCSLETQAQTNALTSGFEIITDSNEAANGRNAGQEYLVLTPEPSSILLSMSGLLGFFAFRRRKTS